MPDLAVTQALDALEQQRLAVAVGELLGELEQARGFFGLGGGLDGAELGGVGGAAAGVVFLGGVERAVEAELAAAGGEAGDVGGDGAEPGFRAPASRIS